MHALRDAIKNLIHDTVVLLAFFLVAAIGPDHDAQADDFTLPLFDSSDQYFERLLRAALRAADGDHKVSTNYITISQNRVLRLLLDNRTDINVVYTGHSRERENLLRQIDIPLSRGLLGYRIFLIKQKNQRLFDGIKTLEELANRITVGSGASWPDTTILRAAGFNVKTGSFENLWQMLKRDRFTAFPRGMNEVHADLQLYQQADVPQPVILENSIMIYYPYDHFFYLAPEDERQAKIIEQGLLRLYENGEFMKIFNDDPAISMALKEAKAQKRTTIKMENPLNSERIEKIPARFWHQFTAN